MLVVLDTGPLGLITHPNPNQEATDCSRWLQSLIATGHEVVLPAIACYELRRELFRLNSTRALALLDDLEDLLDYLPLSDEALRLASKLWADARRQGKPTADAQSLDGDVILAAQALTISGEQPVLIATTNVRHLSVFAGAEQWRQIIP